MKGKQVLVREVTSSGGESSAASETPLTRAVFAKRRSQEDEQGERTGAAPAHSITESGSGSRNEM